MSWSKAVITKMGLRNRQQCFGTPQPSLGVIGALRITTNGTIITKIERYGCVSGVVLTGSAQFNVSVYPPQPFFTHASCCTYVATATLVNASYTAASLTPSTFQIQPAALSPIAGIVAPVIWVTVFGFVKSPLRLSNEPVPSIAHGPLDVVGSAVFSTNTGAITNLRRFGAIKNVRWVSTGTVDVDVWPAQAFYTISGSCSSDGTNSSGVIFPNTPGQTSTGFRAQCLGYGPLVVRECQLFCLTIFGFRKPLMGEATKGLPKGRLGVVGLSKTSVPTTSSIGPYTGYGTLISGATGTAAAAGVNQAILPAQIGGYPAKAANTLEGSYSFMAHPSSDLVTSTFAAWNASLAVGGTPVALNLVSAGYAAPSAPAARACQVFMTSMFGIIS